MNPRKFLNPLIENPTCLDAYVTLHESHIRMKEENEELYKELIQVHMIRAFWGSRWYSPKRQIYTDRGPKQTIRVMSLDRNTKTVTKSGFSLRRSKYKEVNSL